jgi:hypothetical protein
MTREVQCELQEEGRLKDEAALFRYTKGFDLIRRDT